MVPSPPVFCLKHVFVVVLVGVVFQFATRKLNFSRGISLDSPGRFLLADEDRGEVSRCELVERPGKGKGELKTFRNLPPPPPRKGRQAFACVDEGSTFATPQETRSMLQVGPTSHPAWICKQIAPG